MAFSEPASPEPTAAIRVVADADGARLYLIGLPPEALPPVRKRDVELAWEAAHDAACANHWGVLRGFRFRRPDGGTADLVLADPSAACWAAAVDRTMGLATIYGMSLCLRLLALVDLLTRARWLDQSCHLHGGSAHLDVALLRLAAAAPLTAQAGFDDAQFRARLSPPARSHGPSAMPDTAAITAAARRLTGASA